MKWTRTIEQLQVAKNLIPHYLEDTLLLISINFTLKTSNPVA